MSEVVRAGTGMYVCKAYLDKMAVHKAKLQKGKCTGRQEGLHMLSLFKCWRVMKSEPAKSCTVVSQAICNDQASHTGAESEAASCPEIRWLHTY